MGLLSNSLTVQSSRDELASCLSLHIWDQVLDLCLPLVCTIVHGIPRAFDLALNCWQDKLAMLYLGAAGVFALDFGKSGNVSS